jgi:hypothetical protein
MIDDLLRAWAEEAVRKNDGDVENMTRLLRLVYARGQSDARDAMNAAVQPVRQIEPNTVEKRDGDGRS